MGVARKKHLLKPSHISQRLEWARTYENYTAEDWKRVVFSDESPFTLFQWCGKHYARRRVGEEYKPECIIPTVKHGNGKIQIWGIFSYYGVGPLKLIEGTLTGAKYREILKTHMRLFIQRLKKDHGHDFIFQHDNDPKHTSRVVKKYLSTQSYNVF